MVQVLDAFGAVTRIEAAVANESIGMGLLQRIVALGRVEPIDVEVAEIRRLQDRHVDVTLDEKVVVHGLGVVLLELVLGPQLLLGAQARVIVVKAVDELLAVDVLLVCRAAVPKMGVAIDDKDLFAGACFVHGMS